MNRDQSPVPLAPIRVRLAAAEKMLEAGDPFLHITQRLRLSRKTLLRHFPGRAWSKAQTVEAAHLSRALNRIPRRIA